MLIFAHNDDFQEICLAADSKGHAADDYHQVVIFDQFSLPCSFDHYRNHFVDGLKFFNQYRACAPNQRETLEGCAIGCYG